jgi:PTS system mannose-specific IIA component
MVGALLVTHGKLGREILKTAEGILGPQTHTAALSNDGLGLPELREKIAHDIKKMSAPAGTILFVDFLGGSCSNACKAIQASGHRIRVIAGVNLPMLLDFFMYRDKYFLDALTALLLEAGKRNIVEVRP